MKAAAMFFWEHRHLIGGIFLGSVVILIVTAAIDDWCDGVRSRRAEKRNEKGGAS